MSKYLLVLILYVCAGTVAASDAHNTTTSKDASPSTVSSEPPAPLDKKLLEFLQVKIDLQVTDMNPKSVVEWQLRLADVPLTIRQTKKVAEKKVSFELTDVTLAEALRTINTKTGCQYRLVKNEICMAMPQEWTEIDAGKATFDKLVGDEAKTTEKK